MVNPIRNHVGSLEADVEFTDILLDDYTLALGSERMNPELISARVNTILLSIVAAAKEQNSQESSGWGSKDSVQLSIGEAATLPRAFNQEIYYLRSLADGVLWYGEMKELEANLVVQKVTRPIEEDKVAVPGVLCEFSIPILYRHNTIRLTHRQ